MHSRTLLPASPARANRAPGTFTRATRPFAPAVTAETAAVPGSGHDFARVAVSAGVIQRSSGRVRMPGLDPDEERKRDDDSGSDPEGSAVSDYEEEEEETGRASESESDRDPPPLSSAPGAVPQTPAQFWSAFPRHTFAATTPQRPGARSSFPPQGRVVTPQPQPSSSRVPPPQFRTPQPQNETPIAKASRQGLLSPPAHQNPDMAGGRMHDTMRDMIRDLTKGRFDAAMKRVTEGAAEPIPSDDVAARQSYKDPLAQNAGEGRAQIQAYHVESNAMLQRLAARMKKGEELTRDDNVALARMYGRGDALLSRMGGPERARYPGRQQPAQIRAKMQRLQAISTLPMSESSYGETRDAWATRVSSILSFRSLSVGTNPRPADLPPESQASLRKFGQRTMSGKRYLVLAHGKNRHAGGSGEKALNLAPATPWANRQHSQQVEERLKALLFNGEVVGYNVEFPRRKGGGAAPAPAVMSDAEQQKLAQMTPKQQAKYQEERKKKQELMAEERKLPVSIKYDLRRIEMNGQEPTATHRVAAGTIPNRIPTTEPTTLVPVRINRFDPARMKARRGQGWSRRKKPTPK